MLDFDSILFKAMKNCSPEQKMAIIKDVFEELADFIDQHDIIIPELSVTFGGVAVKLSATRLDASKDQPVSNATWTTSSTSSTVK